MRGCFFIHPVFLFPSCAVPSGYPACDPSSVERTALSPATKRFEPEFFLGWVPLINDQLDRHSASPDTGRAFRFICPGIESPVATAAVCVQASGYSVEWGVEYGSHPGSFSILIALVLQNPATSRRGSSTGTEQLLLTTLRGGPAACQPALTRRHVATIIAATHLSWRSHLGCIAYL